ncbi:MAG: DUF1015 domain-containing protein [Candidatus Adiutrix sp.]|nr:DUF1015 domain-containing protein [Candidatus Adiutrix sp.]
MVEIAPFKGVTYSRGEIKDHGGLLVAPPYDVLNDQERRDCLDLHPHNVLHLDYGRVYDGDSEKYAWHQRSGEMLKQWLADGTLTRLDEPAIFHMETECPNPLTGRRIVRRGFVCLMKLEEFGPESQVRPHEKTFSCHKRERLSLMKNTRANLSQVFGFFPDEDRKALSLMKEAVDGKISDMNFKDYRGFTHRVWIDRRTELNAAMRVCLKDRKVYIADGHHRYETALDYRRFVVERDGDQADPAVDYVMIYLCPMSDPGLVILPTHRLLSAHGLKSREIIGRLERFFKIKGKPFADNEAEVRDRFLSKLKKQKNSFGLYLADEKSYFLLKLLESARDEEALAREPKELAALDTVILSNLVFMEALGLTEEDLDNPEVISYVSNLSRALELVRDKKQASAFILNPATVEDILRVTEKGLTMPRKSTYFYPKVTTGLVINLLEP